MTTRTDATWGKSGYGKGQKEAFDDIYARLDNKESENDVYGLARLSNTDGMDVQYTRLG